MKKYLDTSIRVGKAIILFFAVMTVEGELLYVFFLEHFPVGTAKEITYRVALASTILTIFLWNRLNVKWLKK